MNVLLVICFVALALLCEHETSALRSQAMKVRGKITCPAEPDKAVGVKIKLYDEDDGPDPDDLLAETTSGSDGSFQLQGSTREFSNIDPRLKIYHDCLDGIKPCQRKWKLKIPDRYINSDWFDAGVLNLEFGLPDEERDCIH